MRTTGQVSQESCATWAEALSVPLREDPGFQEKRGTVSSVPRVAASVRLDRQWKETEKFGGMRNVVSRWPADSVSGHGA